MMVNDTELYYTSAGVLRQTLILYTTVHH